MRILPSISPLKIGLIYSKGIYRLYNEVEKGGAQLVFSSSFEYPPFGHMQIGAGPNPIRIQYRIDCFWYLVRKTSSRGFNTFEDKIRRGFFQGKSHKRRNEEETSSHP